MDVMELVVGALGGGGLVTMISQWLGRRERRGREEARALREARTSLYRELLRPWATTLAAARAGQDPVQALASWLCRFSRVQSCAVRVRDHGF